MFFLLSNYSKKLQKIQTEENRVEVNNFSENTESKKEDFLNKSETVLSLPTSLISFVENLNIEKENFSVNAPTNLGEKYKVVKVIDGDTVDVLINGKTERLRLIGINTPETLDPRRPVECFGIEASNKAKELLTGKYVFLESDPSQGERDKYERLLRYVFLENGESFNYSVQRLLHGDYSTHFVKGDLMTKKGGHFTQGKFNKRPFSYFDTHKNEAESYGRKDLNTNSDAVIQHSNQCPLWPSSKSTSQTV